VTLPIKMRLTLLYSAILALTLVAFGVALYATTARVTRGVVEDTLTDEAQRLIDGKRIGPNGLSLPVGRFGAPETYVQVRRLDGPVVDRTANLADVELPLGEAGWRAVASGRAWTEEARVDGGTRLLIHTVPITLGERSVAVLQVARSLAEPELALGTLGKILLAGGGAVVVLAFGAGWVLARAALRPIDAVAQTARAIGDAQDLGRRVSYHGPADEVGALARTFDGMLDRLQEAYARVEASLATQKRFVADASHELRTPLTTLRGNLALLEREPPVAPAERGEIVRDMVAECERLSRLVGDLLALARAGAARPPRLQPVPVGGLIEDVCRQVALIDPGRRVEVDEMPRALVLADRDALRQVLLILLDNALKFTPASGRVGVEAWQDGEHVAIGVRDSGPGIAPEALPHVTERFYRGDSARSGAGAGLGLAIAKALVEAQGGTLGAESRVGVGSLFTVSLPRAGLVPAEVAV
jgi:two-component system OmpR family sensor kinase